ncbi:MAG: peptidylprolyl isomerase [Calditrichota bacterium]
MKFATLSAVILAMGLIVSCSKTPPQTTEKSKSTQTSTMSTPNPGTTPTDAKAVPQSAAPAPNQLTPPTKDEVGAPDEVAVIETEWGDIVVEFFPDVAPLHVANFKKLTRAGFYDGTTFHRVLPGFVIQGGDPNTKDSNPNNDGMGGPPYRVPDEFNNRLHEHGILSMAHSSEPNSAGSQFFICLGRTPHLDNQYTVFGKVIKGLDVVDKIGALRRDPSNPHDRQLPAVRMRHVKILKKSELGL